jgi:hypothetical protein
MGWIEGFVSALNFMASTHRTAGQDLDAESRFRWILDYCSAHPDEELMLAALAFRDDLIAHGM